MHMYELSSCEDLSTLISTTTRSQEPVVISNNGTECLVAMHPLVFENILFGTAILDSVDRTSLHL